MYLLYTVTIININRGYKTSIFFYTIDFRIESLHRVLGIYNVLHIFISRDMLLNDSNKSFDIVMLFYLN
jgi:hypothetical protein